MLQIDEEKYLLNLASKIGSLVDIAKCNDYFDGYLVGMMEAYNMFVKMSKEIKKDEQ